MCVDEPGDHDVAAGVDHLGIGGVEVRADRLDAIVFDEDIGVRQLAERRVLRQHDPTLDQRPLAHVCLLSNVPSGMRCPVMSSCRGLRRSAALPKLARDLGEVAVAVTGRDHGFDDREVRGGLGQR